jgi:hypothetical protein
MLALGVLTFVNVGQVAQAQAIPGADWAPAAGAMGDNTYQGFIDQPANGATVAQGASFNVSGWVVDTTAQGWSGIDGVEVMLGNTVLTNATVGLPRPDVAAVTGNPNAANSGFQGTVKGGVPSGSQTLTVVAHTPDKGSWSKQVTINVSAGGTVVNTASGLVLKIISPSSSDLIVSNNNGTIYGVAYDTRTRPELGVGVDRVYACLDAPCGQAGSQSLGDAVFNGDNWSITWSPTKYNNVRHHVLYVYAHSLVTGETLQLTEEINLSP